MRYAFTVYVKNDNESPAVDENHIQIGNYAVWDHVFAVSEEGAKELMYDRKHGIDELDSAVKEAINKAVKKFSDTLKGSYIFAGEVIEQAIIV